MSFGPEPSVPQRLPAIIVLMTLTAAGLLMWHFGEYLLHTLQAIRYPFQLDYGEGIVWQQALLIPGRGMYGDITRYPFIVFHYPPVYHLVVRALTTTGMNWLEAGRAVSGLSTLAIGVVAGTLAALATPTGIGRVPRLTGAAIAGLSVFCYEPVVMWSPLMRVDMLAVALEFLGVLCVVTAPGRPVRLTAGGLLLLLAMFTKQTSIAATLATFPIMLVVDRRRTIKAASIVLLAGLSALLLLSCLTDAGFIRHILFYNINRYDISSLADAIWSQRRQVVFFVLAIAAAIARGRRLWHEHTPSGQPRGRYHSLRRSLGTNLSTRLSVIVLLYFIVTISMLPMLGKSGASTNYLIEAMCVWSVVIGMAVATTLERAIARFARSRLPVTTILLGWLLVLQMILLPTANDTLAAANPAEDASLQSLQNRIQAMPGPVLSDDMVLLLRAGKEVPWEPAIFAELASTGRWDEHLITDRITAHAFAAILTTGVPGDGTYDQRFTPAVSRAIQAAYPRTETIAGRVLHLPPR